jgi:hypothetical protein
MLLFQLAFSLLAFVSAFPVEISSRQDIANNSTSLEQTTAVKCTSCLSLPSIKSFSQNLHYRRIPGLNLEQTITIVEDINYALLQSKVKQRELEHDLKKLKKDDGVYAGVYKPMLYIREINQIHRDAKKWEDLEVKAKLGLEFVKRFGDHKRGKLDVEGVKKALEEGTTYFKKPDGLEFRQN